MILALYGAGAMGREFKYIANESGEWSEIIFIDDHTSTTQLLGCPVFGFHAFRTINRRMFALPSPSANRSSAGRLSSA